ncbi:hypothetical protein RI129_005808 [Pyrocoelia pectoralis]|uniref:Protein kinase domain-containing protein n=1 Tax=Pyrocoelia pectoralis TaxID=417401 RepID=A0AAN7VFV8_9COLE
MVVGEPNINNIMGGIENTGTVRLHNHRKKLKQRFDIIKKLGQGTYGKVQLGINKETGQEVAIKTIKKSKIETEADLVRIRREIQIMSSVQHPNIIHIYEVFENREKMVLVMEYAAGGELYDYLSERKVLAEEEARRIFRQIATACYYCHKHKICHRDLKLENILLDENGNAKIADFGLSNVFDDQRLLSTFCGSPLYASPEIVKGTPYQGPEVDCWSLGVLLYTLVYGAMPFDGSNFKRLVRQISQGDYFEPKKPSRASPLIRDMLTVNPRNRANIEKICLHWWVNESYDECCLDISEELANQTPVRLDLLLSLAPPPPQLESEKLVVTGETPDESNCNTEAAIPTRSHSVGSLMELSNPAQRRIKDLLLDDVKVSPKRKLETTISTDQISSSKEDIKRKEKIIKENTIADITLHSTQKIEGDRPESQIIKSQTQTLSRDMDISEEFIDPSTQGAACAEIIEDAKKNMTEKVLEASSPLETLDKENKDINIESKEEKIEEKQSKIPAKRKPVKKKVLTDKNDNLSIKTEQPEKVENNNQTSKDDVKTEAEEMQPINKPVERRRSRIFETAEKFQNMISANESKVPIDKPKKIIIPGVSVGGYKKEFERKASLTSNNIGLPKKPVEQEDVSEKAILPKSPPCEVVKDERNVTVAPEQDETVSPSEEQLLAEKERKIQIKNAVDIISTALEKDGTRKSKSRPCMVRKPPVPFGVGGRSASGSIATLPTPLSPPNTPLTLLDLSETGLPNILSSIPAQVMEETKTTIPEEDKTSSAEITLKSATLPRRKTTKAEIKLDYPAPQPAAMGFKTEMAHHVEGQPKLTTQRSEVTFPVTPSVTNSYRSASCEPENKAKPRERIIPISFERDVPEERRESLTSPTIKPPVTRIFQTQRSTTSQRSNKSNITSGEPIRKSPREYIIPIAVEGGGYVTPRAGSLEPSDTTSTTSTMTSKSKFNRARRLNDREGSEDESPFAALHKHSSFGRDSDTEDSRRDIFRMHSLRSSRPRKANMEHNDSFSSGEDDDDDGFEILTAENLFSTLLSRVRDLTQRLNVDGRPGFPTSRLLSSHFDRGGNFWNLRPDPLPSKLCKFSCSSRSLFIIYSSLGRSSREQSVESSTARNFGTPWRRSVSRDLASDIDSVFNNSMSPPTHTATLPRGDSNSNSENLNLTNLDLKKLKLSDEDALALSYLTPGLSRRIQKQLLAQLAPSEVKKLSRTLSMRSNTDNKGPSSDRNRYDRQYSDNTTRTIPRRATMESSQLRYQNNRYKTEDKPDPNSNLDETKSNKSFLPKKSVARDSDLNHSRLRSLDTKLPHLLTPSEMASSEKIKEEHSDTSRLCKYLLPTNYENISRSQTPTLDSERGRSEHLYQSCNTRKPSRFLRPDFYDNKDANYFLKEKKERELETQKVLKEIRDRRKSRFRDQSLSKEINGQLEKFAEDKSISGSTDEILKNVSDNIRKIENNVQEMHEYVNLPVQSQSTDEKIPEYVNVNINNNNNETTPVVKKSNTSKISRPKSYPAETHEHKKLISKIPEFSSTTKSKIAKAKKTDKDVEKPNKNKFLHSIEKKFEKLRSFSNSPTTSGSEETKGKDDKKSSVEDTIKRLREQSLPRTADNCITESGLIKRAVSVEDLSSSDPKLQTSRKSVTKILNLFKKYEEKGNKKSEKSTKTKKPKDETKTKVKNKSQLEAEKTDKNNKPIGAATVISNNVDQQTVKVLQRNDVPKIIQPEVPVTINKKIERPSSLLLLDCVKPFHTGNNGAKSDGNISVNRDAKRGSKLPVNSFRRSLNLENSNTDSHNTPSTNHEGLANCKSLALDLEHSPHDTQENRNSFATTDDSSLLLSPFDDNMSCDSWSVCSDYHTQELTSPISPCGTFYSADENESVSDRIRRKSFYTRFNEKKRPRKCSMNSYRDLDLYKDVNGRKSNYRSNNFDYSEQEGVKEGKSCYGGNVDQEPLRYKRYGYSHVDNSNEVLNEHFPNRYQTYNPRFYKRSTSVSASDTEDFNTLDESSTTGKHKIYYNQPSRISSRSISPISGPVPVDLVESSINQRSVISSTSQNHA